MVLVRDLSTGNRFGLLKPSKTATLKDLPCNQQPTPPVDPKDSNLHCSFFVRGDALLSYQSGTNQQSRFEKQDLVLLDNQDTVVPFSDIAHILGA